LHSKIYLFDNVVIVGSANLSKHSREDLVEAAIISDNRDLIKQATKFIQRLKLMSKQITLEIVRKLKEKYQPPKFEARTSDIKPKPNLWITSVQVEDYPDEDREEVKKKEKELKRHMDKDNNIITLWSSRAYWKVGDLIVQIRHENGRVKVIAPSPVIELYKRPKYVYSFLLGPRGRKLQKTWKEFKKVMNKAGYRRISKNSHRLVKSDKVKEAIYDLFELLITSRLLQSWRLIVISGVEKSVNDAPAIRRKVSLWKTKERVGYGRVLEVQKTRRHE